MNRPPFVYLYDDAQEALQILARGKNAAVWLTLGILLPTHPDGVSSAEIVRLTGLTKETVDAALTSLTVSKLIEHIGGNFAPSRYIEYRKASKKILSDASDKSINRQSNHQSNQGLNVGTEVQDSFEKAMRAVAAMLLPYGGMKANEYTAFKELWNDCADPATHARAIEITLASAERPNYRYYEKVVLTGAQPTTYPTKQERVKRAKETAAIEIVL